MHAAWSCSDGLSLASLSFSDVARVVDTRNEADLRALIDSLIHSPKELEALFRLLMPQEDRAHAFHLQARRLMRCIHKASLMRGASADSLLLAKWTPEPVRTYDPALIISLPETAIALVAARQGGGKSASVRDIVEWCDRASGQGETAQIQMLASLLGKLDVPGWSLLARILLKLPILQTPPAYAYQRDFGALVVANQGESRRCLCGVPFVPMTCSSLRSPYLLRGLFSHEDHLRSLPALVEEGHLLYMDSVKRNKEDEGESGGPKKKTAKQIRMTSLETMAARFPSPSSSQGKEEEAYYYYATLVACLQAVKREGRLQLGERTQGWVLHYSLYVDPAADNEGEEDDDDGPCFLLLLRGLSPARENGVVLDDDNVVPVISSSSNNSDDSGMMIVSLESLLLMRSASSQKKTKVTVAVARQSRYSKSSKAKKKKVAAQLKYDGDRLQAHILSPVDIRLFSKSGYDVTDLYSDLCAHALASIAMSVAPCILDGELIVVNAENGVPLPWEADKWRYNNNTASGKYIDAAKQKKTKKSKEEEEEGVFVAHASEPEDPIIGDVSWEHKPSRCKEDDVTFYCGARKDARPLAVANGTLRYILFDMLMCRGQDLCRMGYAERLARLEATLQGALRGNRYARVITPTHWISTSQELVELMREATRQGWEGYVLKDPDAPYAFERTRAMQKLKVGGPDINVGVVGVGFSANNPRAWGAITVISRAATTTTTEAEYYCRIESTAVELFESVLGAASCVRAHDVLEAMARASKDGRERCVREQVYVSPEGSIRWGAHHVVHGLSVERLKRMEAGWLCDPWECAYRLSLQCDARPHRQIYPKHCVPRVEANPPEGGWMDTPEHIQRKFEEATAVDTCIERHMLRTLAALRALPPVRWRLLEAERIVDEWRGHFAAGNSSCCCRRLDDLSRAWTTAARALSIMHPNEMAALCALRPEERAVLHTSTYVPSEEQRALYARLSTRPPPLISLYHSCSF